MIRKILLISIITLLSTSLTAQVYYGFKVGANLANFYGDIENNSIKASFHIGAVAEISVSDLFSVQPELLFSMQGSQGENNSLLTSHTSVPIDGKDFSSTKTNFYYLNLPVMVKYFVTDMISIDAGPQVGYLLYAKESNGTDELTDIKDLTKSIDYGLNLGGSYEMDNGMNINLRYYYGLANVLDSNDAKMNNALIQISLGYKFY